MKSRHEIIKAKAKLNTQLKTKKAIKHINAGLVLMAAGAVLSHVSANNNVVVQAQTSTRMTQSEFLGLITDYAKQIAAENDLYASVMIAQAALESGWGNSTLSQAPNYNLFGIKGEYNGNTVVKNTLEDDGTGQYYQIQDGFRRYDNYGQSLTDYASLLTGDNDPNNWRYSFYSGARYSNTTSYQDATAYLTGRYATDTRYADKLNRIIAENNLTEFDVARSADANQEVTEQPTTQTPDTSSVAGTYTVKAGDGYWAIARRYGTTVEALKAINGASSNLIHPGQVLKLPGNSAIVDNNVTQGSNNESSTTQPNNSNNASASYTIQRGDGLYAIARQYGMTLNELKSLNGLTSNLIHPGQVLKVKASASTSKPVEESTSNSNNTGNATSTNNTNNNASAGTYSVKPGEGLYRIALNHGMTLNELKALNGLSSNLIHPGQVLKVSSNNTTTTTTVTTPVEAQTSSVTTPVVEQADTIIEADVTEEVVNEVVEAPVVNETVEIPAPVNTHTVQAGDTLYSIAKRNGLDVYQLIENNNGSSTIFVGQTIGLN